MGVVDAIQLALDALDAAPDLAGSLEQVAVGAARITDASRVVLVLQRGDHANVVAAVGRDATAWGEERVRRGRVGLAPADATVVDFAASLAGGLLLLDSPVPDRLHALALYSRCASALVDLRILRTRAAEADHQVLPPDRVAGVLGSAAAGDGIVLVHVEESTPVAALAGETDHAAVSAVVQHLLQGTRPPGDVVAQLSTRSFLLVLRSLKAPVDVVGLRLLDGWRAAHADVVLSLGAAMHEEGEAPLDSFARAEEALESCRRHGGGLHIAADPPRRDRV